MIVIGKGAIRNFRLPVVRAALAMVAFDVLLHVVIGWGIIEGQIYCGHWFWIIPLLVAFLPKRTAFIPIARFCVHIGGVPSAAARSVAVVTK